MPLIALPSCIAIRNERKHCTWDFISKAPFVFNKGIIVYLTVQSVCASEGERICSWCAGDSVLLALYDRILSIPSSAGLPPLSSQQCCLPRRCTVHCYSVLSVGSTAVSKTVATLC
jgi:hypothetical protein